MHEVIVIGAGPAGCAAAAALGLRGRDVVLLERAHFPRPKLCAGGLPPKVVGALPVRTSDLVERSVSCIRFTWRGAHRFDLGFDRAVVHMVDRARLDERLCRQAVRLGARLREGVRVTRIEPGPEDVLVHTRDKTLRARAVIAADGALGAGARLLGRSGIRAVPAAQAEVRVSDREMRRWEHTLGCDFGVVPGGIGWVFPKSDRLSVGVCTFRPPADLRAAFEALLHAAGIQPVVRPVLRAHPLPAWDGRRVFSRGAVLVAGDAAGLVNPLTGAGIRRACIAGTLAAEAVHAYLAGGAKSLHDLGSYERRIREDLLEELARARLFARLFYRAPGTFHRLGIMSARVNPWIGELLSGQKGYTQVFADILRGRWLRR